MVETLCWSKGLKWNIAAKFACYLVDSSPTQPNPVVLLAHHKPCPFSQLFWFLLHELVFLILNICLWQPSSEVRLHASVLWLKLSYGVLKQSLPFLFSLNESVKQFYDLTVSQVSAYCDHCTLLEDPRVLQTVLVIRFFGMSQIYSFICQERRVQMLVLSTVEHYRSVYTGLCCIRVNESHGSRDSYFSQIFMALL